MGAYAHATSCFLSWPVCVVRYVLSTRDQPEALLTRCLSFYAYTVNQVRRTEPLSFCRVFRWR